MLGFSPRGSSVYQAYQNLGMGCVTKEYRLYIYKQQVEVLEGKQANFKTLNPTDLKPCYSAGSQDPPASASPGNLFKWEITVPLGPRESESVFNQDPQGIHVHMKV